jgi:hypothetical protein
MGIHPSDEQFDQWLKSLLMLRFKQNVTRQSQSQSQSQLAMNKNSTSTNTSKSKSNNHNSNSNSITTTATTTVTTSTSTSTNRMMNIVEDNDEYSVSIVPQYQRSIETETDTEIHAEFEYVLPDIPLHEQIVDINLDCIKQLISSHSYETSVDLMHYLTAYLSFKNNKRFQFQVVAQLQFGRIAVVFDLI